MRVRKKVKYKEPPKTRLMYGCLDENLAHLNKPWEHQDDSIERTMRNLSSILILDAAILSVAIFWNAAQLRTFSGPFGFLFPLILYLEIYCYFLYVSSIAKTDFLDYLRFFFYLGFIGLTKMIFALQVLSSRSPIKTTSALFFAGFLLDCIIGYGASTHFVRRPDLFMGEPLKLGAHTLLDIKKYLAEYRMSIVSEILAFTTIIRMFLWYVRFEFTIFKLYRYSYTIITGFHIFYFAVQRKNKKPNDLFYQVLALRLYLLIELLLLIMLILRVLPLEPSDSYIYTNIATMIIFLPIYIDALDDEIKELRTIVPHEPFYNFYNFDLGYNHSRSHPI